MKKRHNIFIFCIIVAGGAIFLRGWLQLAVPQGAVGILSSKTHGTRDKVVRGGSFDWVWYRSIPWNATIQIFHLKPSRFNIEISGKLPLAETLTTFTGIVGKYDWKILGNCSFSVRPESLTGIVERNSIKSQGDFEQWEAQFSSELSSWARRRMLSYFENDGDLRKNFSNSVFEKKLADDILTAYPFLIDVEFGIVMEETPDFEQWEASRAVYIAYLDKQRSILQGEATTQAARKIASQFRLDELSRYGELLTKYPVLLQYLEFEKRFDIKLQSE